jgi:hypothetical protein
MPQYAILIYGTDSAHGANAGEAARVPHDRYAQELEQSGAIRAAFALEPVATATSIRSDIVTDGPFLDAKEVVAGLYVIDAPHLDAALDIAKRNPAIEQGGGVEVRPVHGSYIRPSAGA